MAGASGWAARFQFLDELWRGRDRIIFDPALEESLRVGGGGLGHGSHPASMALADALIPREVVEEDVWVALTNPRRAAEFARLRAGTTFVGLDEASSLGTDEDWQVAIVDLQGMLADGSGAIEMRLEARLAAFVEVLAEGAQAGRTVVLSAPADGVGGLDYPAFSSLVATVLPQARVYGLCQASAALVFDFGEVAGSVGAVDVAGTDGELALAEHAESAADPEVADYEAELDAAERAYDDGNIDGGEAYEDDEEVPIDYDNGLGDAEPAVATWIAVACERAPSEGLTVIELPGLPEAGPLPHDGGLRAQLVQVQHQADLAAIERQRLLEQLDEAEERIGTLTDEREQILDGTADGVVAGTIGRLDDGTADSAPRLDAALAREQTLRWQLVQVRAELEQARARPVDDTEAELARLRALTRAGTNATPGRGSDGQPPHEVDSNRAGEPGASPAPRPAGDAEHARLRSEVDRLLRRIERGGMPSRELHRSLRRLRSHFHD